MGDVMLLGVLRMPYDMAMHDEMSRRQLHSRCREAARRIESDGAYIARLTAERDAIAVAAFEAAGLTCGRVRRTQCVSVGEMGAAHLCEDAIRALTPADAKAALDVRDRAKVAEGLRMAAEIAEPRVKRWLEIEPPFDGTLDEAIYQVSDIADAILSRAKDMEAGNG